MGPRGGGPNFFSNPSMTNASPTSAPIPVAPAANQILLNLVSARSSHLQFLTVSWRWDSTAAAVI